DTSVNSLVLICSGQICTAVSHCIPRPGGGSRLVMKGGTAGFSTMYSHNTMVEYCIHRTPVNRNTNSIS
ncbi:MAG: hypothetical protein WA460_04340, partial [Nitrososphaeraceae archaeon]